MRAKMPSVTYRGQQPWRLYVCPTCHVEFTAWTENGGKTCPNGHWHSMYQLRVFEQNGRLPGERVRRLSVQRQVCPPKPAGLALAELGFEHRAEQCELALQMWLAAYDRLLSQLPASLARQLLAGAFERTAGISRQLVPAP